ncbi:hypothetical protein BBF96_12775 [Anoxybacter fermentans]|uniref:histidine kinase n=1 Tax=Anoxybacter fermentans TaxID=1323375 RepID=A0A3Q9HSE7_9FIRM|nr:ATP-binding protein [Anoxybacter fermentans]AZR74194.1 hypothetical protein BBF96_12775 [Anoxybacter fermentans]
MKKWKKNERALEKKIRRIIGIEFLFIFILLVGIYIWFAYQFVMSGTLIITEIFGKVCLNLVDGDDLNKINSMDDFTGPEYKEITRKLKETFSWFWENGVIQFSIIKKLNGQMVSIIDSKDELFTSYQISPEVMNRLEKYQFSGKIEYVKRPYNIIAYTPIWDSKGEMAGIFVAKLNPNIWLRIFDVMILIIILLIIAVFIFNLGVTRIMMMRIVRPLEILAQKIRMVARVEDDLTERITFKKTYKEVEDLAEATNMVMDSTKRFVKLLEDKQARLEEKNQQLTQQAKKLAAQTEELKFLNENLEDAMKQLQDTQIQLVQSERMASLGELTAGVAHEINTPLGAINSNTDIIEMVIGFLKEELDLEHNEKVAQMFDKLKKANDTNKLACDRIIKIVRQLKNFSRLDDAEFQEVSLHDGIESVLILSHNLLKHRIKVHKEFGEIPPVKCFPNQLNQVFMNIIVNAAQAIENNGDIWIKTWAKGDKVFVQIRDNGIGIPPENLHRIFDPGFTTKEKGIGTGLGLSICRKIIEKHNGKISVESEVGKGTAFTIELPINNTFGEI